MTDWPDSLIGTLILVESYQSSSVYSGVRTEMESGFNRSRLAELNPLRTLQTTFLFSSTQLQYFNAWFEYTARDGELWFNIDLPVDGPARTVKARFVDEPQEVPTSSVTDYWKVSAKLEVRDDNQADAAELAESIANDGTFPVATFGNPIIDGYGHARNPSGDRSGSDVDGTPRFRERIPSPFRKVSLSWQLSDANVRLFNAWYRFTAKQQAGFWTISLNLDGVLRACRARFLADPSISNVSVDVWICSAQIEVRDVNYWSKTDFPDAAAIIALDIPAMLDAIDDLSLDPFFDAWDIMDDYVWPDLFPLDDGIPELLFRDGPSHLLLRNGSSSLLLRDG